MAPFRVLSHFETATDKFLSTVTPARSVFATRCGVSVVVDKTHMCIARKVFAVEFAVDLNVSAVNAVVLSPSVVLTQIQTALVTTPCDRTPSAAAASLVIHLYLTHIYSIHRPFTSRTA